MSSITLTNAIVAVRSRADMVGSSFVTDDEITRWINEEAAELHDLLVSSFEDEYTIVSGNAVVASGNTISLASSTSWCPASAPFYKLRGIDRLESGSSDWRKLSMFNFNMRNVRSAGSHWFRSREIRYRLVGAAIYLTPDDAATGTYRLWYVPGYVDLSAGGDALTFPENWHQYVLEGAAAKCRLKQEDDASAHLGAKAGLRARIASMAANRDIGSRMRIEDVRGGYDEDDD